MKTIEAYGIRWFLVNKRGEPKGFPFKVTHRGEVVNIIGGQPPHKASSTGFVQEEDNMSRTYAHCYDLKWIMTEHYFIPELYSFIDGWMNANPPHDDGISSPPNEYDNLDEQLPACLAAYCKKYHVPTTIGDFDYIREKFCTLKELY